MVKYVGIGLVRTSTLPQVIAEVVDIGLLRPADIPILIADDIIVVILVEVYIGHKIIATHPLAIGEKYFMLKVEVDIGLRPATTPPIANFTMLDC